MKPDPLTLAAVLLLGLLATIYHGLSLWHKFLAR